MMICLGITGGICTGKSTFLSLFEAMGIPCWSADAVVKKIYEEDKDFKEKLETICKEYSYQSVVELKKSIYKNPEILSLLEAYLHPKVRCSLLDFKSNNKDEILVACETPLLFENKMTDFFDKIVVTDVPKSLQKKRFIERKTSSLSLLEFLSQRQLEQIEKVKRADFIVDMTKPIDVVRTDAVHIKDILTSL